ncbi:MAG: hypothetical protein HFJ26_01615 [Clostridia bacterium]|nr:hypothetical protein [Clostridia bacterium]
MDELDKKILEVVNKKIIEPPKYEETIRNTFKNYTRTNQYNILKKVAIIILCISTIGGITFGRQISEMISNMFKKNTSDERNNEYIQIVENEYQTINNLSVRINSIGMDDFTIQLDVEYVYTEPITQAESKILIKDEQNNIIFKNSNEPSNMAYSSKKAERRSYKDLLKYGESTNMIIEELETLEETTKVLTGNYQSTYRNIEDNRLKRTIVLGSGIDFKKFPKSKKIYIQLEDIELKNRQNIVKRIQGKWNFEIDLNSKLVNREITRYVTKDLEHNKQEFRVMEAELSNLQLQLKIEYVGNQNLTQIIDMSDLGSIQIFDKKHKYYINPTTLDIIDNRIVKVNFDVNRNNVSDELKIIIRGINEIEILKCI